MKSAFPHRDSMSNLLGRALDAPSSAEGDLSEVTDEHLAMLAAGRLDDLSGDLRRRVLLKVATDPESATLVRELRELNLDEADAADSQGEDQIDAATERMSAAFRKAQSRLKTFGVAWAMAACLSVSMLSWRTWDPVAPGSIASDYPQQQQGDTGYPPISLFPQGAGGQGGDVITDDMPVAPEVSSEGEGERIKGSPQAGETTGAGGIGVREVLLIASLVTLVSLTPMLYLTFRDAARLRSSLPATAPSGA